MLTLQLKNSIIDNVKVILHENHINIEKRNLIERKDRLNFACPYCGDSHDSNLKKRGNIYWSNLYYHCYNCSVHKPLNIFLNDFNKSLLLNDNLAIINYIKENNNFNDNSNLDFYLFDSIKEYALNINDIFKIFNLTKIDINSSIYNYLKNRCLHFKLDRFGYNEYTNQLYIFNKTLDDKVIGFQIRNFNKNIKYDTWNIERIYGKINRKLNVDDDTLFMFNKISMIFNILHVNFNVNFNVYEGPIDSFFIRNSLGLSGVKKKITEFDEMENVRYFFDNDIDGKNKMIEKIKKGKYVFLWDKLIQDFNITKKIKDFNDLVVYDVMNQIGILTKIDNYISNDELDMIYL